MDLAADDMADPASANFVLCLVRKGQAHASFAFGDRRWSGMLLPGMFTPVTPPHVAGEIRLAAPQRHLMVTFPSAMVAATLGGWGEDLGVVHDRPFRDPLLSQICQSLWDAAADPEPGIPLFEEYALAALIAGLARHSRNGQPAPCTGRALSNREWALVDAYIGEQLDGDLSLRALAELVDMNQHAFLGAFKSRSGYSPHQFILRRRIASARAMLADSSLSLAEIALRVGFADQAHMTSTFSRLTGETPGRLRRQHSGAPG